MRCEISKVKNGLLITGLAAALFFYCVKMVLLGARGLHEEFTRMQAKTS